MKTLLNADKDIFKPSEFGTFSPYSMIVDVSKFENPSKDLKELLYRPTKVKAIYDKYWKLFKICENRDKEENDRKTLKDYYPRYPKKSPEEYEMIEKVIAKVQELIDEDIRAFGDPAAFEDAFSLSE